MGPTATRPIAGSHDGVAADSAAAGGTDGGGRWQEALGGARRETIGFSLSSGLSIKCFAAGCNCR